MTAEPQFAWSRFTVFTFEEGRVVAENAASGARVAIQSERLAQFLAGHPHPSRDALIDGLEKRGFAESSSESNDSVLDDWIKRGWRRSLEYYLWSERVLFADWDDHTNAQRNAVMADVAQQRPVPRRREPARDGRRVELPAPGLPDERDVGDTLLNRRTIRSFAQAELTAQTLSAILWFGLESTRESRRRGGAEPPAVLETFGVGFDFAVITYSVSGIEEAVWDLDLLGNVLIRRRAMPLRRRMVDLMCGMPAALSANATVVLLADFDQWRYRYRHERALRNLYIEAGRIGQALIFAAEAFGCGCLITPATHDRELAALLGVDSPRFAPVYTITFGQKKPGRDSPSPISGL